MYAAWGGAPAAGVVTGIGWIEGVPHMIVANDATVKAGAFFPATAKKVIRAQRIAFQNRLPLVYLVDSAGIFLPLQENVFPDRDDFGRIFRNNSVLSAAGIPQIAAVMGFCVAGGSYLPVLCDKLLMTDGSGLYLAGPALVKSAIGQQVSSDELGGAEMHASLSGTVDYRERDDEACLDRVRRLVLARGDLSLGGGGVRESASATARDPAVIGNVLESNAHDWTALLECVVDRETLELRGEHLRSGLLCGTARIGGFRAGIVASHTTPRDTQATSDSGAEAPSPAQDRLSEMAQFIGVCDRESLPMVFVQNHAVDGPTAGRGESRAAFFRALTACRVPRLSMIVGGEFGSASRTLCGRAFDPRFIFAWPNARFVSEGTPESLAAQAPVDLGDVRHGAARGWVDAILDPAATRDALITSLSIALRRPTEASGPRL